MTYRRLSAAVLFAAVPFAALAADPTPAAPAAAAVSAPAPETPAPAAAEAMSSMHAEATPAPAPLGDSPVPPPPGKRACNMKGMGPMAGMGPDETERMVALLIRLKGSTTVLLVEHDMDAVFRIADRITVMVNGEVIASDAPAAIRANRDVQTAYLGEGH